MSFGDDTLHPDDAKAKADYERGYAHGKEDGFVEGLRWVAQCLRASAAMVELPIRSDFENKELGQTFRAISRSGQPHYASKLREVAALLENATARS